ncbi:molybdopterin converting factor subunit 1 [Azospirillum thermophilum]|uniref:Molybdopterin synthase sulfur carrier subunit n=1 Tax=Azospirillum thermophilum TaxID=2202148 RepID=A0A2S2CMB1_9PROT|nr:molybdopterin converting factor subunit 1 [Azospirillum thermophilum]AWK85510.1 molybdopterin converting factor subunit 1 [Azospirillum thermophilum]
MKVLYFAWLRSKIGVPSETVDLPADVTDVAGLIEWLKSRSPRHAEALANSKVVKVAVNQEHVPYDHPLSASDEVALFPPVTGG